MAARRARDVVQNLLAEENERAVRERAAAAAGASAAAPEEDEMAWMEQELRALQRNSNRMAEQAGMEVPYPEADQDS